MLLQAKRDLLKKEGKLLTPKQKAERAAAEIRLKALVGTAGNTIAGLQESVGGDDEGKRVSYAKKKPFKKPVETKVEPAVVVVAEPQVVPAVAVDDDDVKDDWDASDDEEAKPAEKAESVKDDWDASDSEEDVPAATAPAPAIAPLVVKTSVVPVSKRESFALC